MHGYFKMFVESAMKDKFVSVQKYLEYMSRFFLCISYELFYNLLYILFQVFYTNILKCS